MEEYTQITLDQWVQWKEDIRRKLGETASNFVYIGYRLKQIRDSGMYDGAADIFEFAEKEYGLGKSTVSRFIAINERYSEGGNSLELKEEFKGFSSSKLAEMLTIPDSEIQLITEKTTIREIRELKNFNADAERGETGAAGDEAAGFAPEQKWTQLEKCLIDFFKDKKEVLNGVVMHLDADPAEYKEAAELMAPSGQASHRKGIMFLFMYDWNTGIKYKLMTEPDPVSMSWMELLNAVYRIFGACGQEDVWNSFYGEPEKQQEEHKEDAQNKPVENAAPAQSIQGVEDSVATSQQESELAGNDTADFENDSEEIEQKETDLEDNGTEEDEDAEVEGDETDCELQGEEREAGTENELSERECEDDSDAGGCSDGISEDDGQDGEETGPGSTESVKRERYLMTAERIKQEVRNRADDVFQEIKQDGDHLHWRNIKHRLNNLSNEIEQLIKYLDLTEDEEESEE